MFVVVEDMTSAVEVIIFPSLLKKNSEVWQEDKLVLLKGKISDKDDVPKILVDNVVEIDHNNPAKALEINGLNGNSNGNVSQLPVDIYISIDESNFTKDIHFNLKNIFENNYGRNRVFFLIGQNGSTRKIATNFYINIDEEIQKQIDDIVGNGKVEKRII